MGRFVEKLLPSLLRLVSLSNGLTSHNLNVFFQWSQILQITLLALGSSALKILPRGGCVPFAYLCSYVPSSLVRSTGSGKEGTVRQETLVLALASATDAWLRHFPVH